MSSYIKYYSIIKMNLIKKNIIHKSRLKIHWGDITPNPPPRARHCLSVPGRLISLFFNIIHMVFLLNLLDCKF